jgi:hypothetical protein
MTRLLGAFPVVAADFLTAADAAIELMNQLLVRDCAVRTMTVSKVFDIASKSWLCRRAGAADRADYLVM